MENKTFHRNRNATFARLSTPIMKVRIQDWNSHLEGNLILPCHLWVNISSSMTPISILLQIWYFYEIFEQSVSNGLEQWQNWDNAEDSLRYNKQKLKIILHIWTLHYRCDLVLLNQTTLSVLFFQKTLHGWHGINHSFFSILKQWMFRIWLLQPDIFSQV